MKFSCCEMKDINKKLSVMLISSRFQIKGKGETGGRIRGDVYETFSIQRWAFIRESILSIAVLHFLND